ncbi:MAG: carboxymuconolactone decarboxylase family protein [Acidimicrobiales bacterium]
MSPRSSDQTTTAGRRPWEPRLDFDAHAPGFARAMAALDHAAVAQADEAGLTSSLRELVRLRASQLNGCAYCVDMHAKDARAADNSDQRLDALAVWREAPFYSEAEAAALDLAEAITLCADGHVPDAVWTAAAERFSPTELSALVALIVTVNAWNRIGVTTRTWLPGTYTP